MLLACGFVPAGPVFQGMPRCALRCPGCTAPTTLPLRAVARGWRAACSQTKPRPPWKAPVQRCMVY
eukprot:8315909-Prorocentrum_lima.AAC.1